MSEYFTYYYPNFNMPHPPNKMPMFQSQNSIILPNIKCPNQPYNYDPCFDQFVENQNLLLWTQYHNKQQIKRPCFTFGCKQTVNGQSIKCHLCLNLPLKKCPNSNCFHFCRGRECSHCRYKRIKTKKLNSALTSVTPPNSPLPLDK